MYPLNNDEALKNMRVERWLDKYDVSWDSLRNRNSRPYSDSNQVVEKYFTEVV